MIGSESRKTWFTSFRAYAGKPAALAFLFILNLACRDPENNPHRLADLFVMSVETSSMDILDSIMDWNEVVINDYYVTRDFFIAQTTENKEKIVDDYKERLLSDFLPSAAKASLSPRAFTATFATRNI